MTPLSMGMWSSPKTVMVIAQAFDHPGRVLLAVQYAEREHARVILAQLASLPGADRSFRRRKPSRHTRAITAENAISWTERCSLWSEILNRVFLVGAIRVENIAGLAGALGADGILLTDPDLAEQIWRGMFGDPATGAIHIPTWVLGRNVAPVTDPPSGTRRILLPLSLRTGFEARLNLAFELAILRQATLAILHVVTRADSDLRRIETPWEVNDRLREFFSKLSDVRCPIEISVRDGDPAEAILNFDAQHPHELVIIRSPRCEAPVRSFRGITKRILGEARRPVIVVKADSPDASGTGNSAVASHSYEEVAFGSTSGAIQ